MNLVPRSCRKKCDDRISHLPDEILCHILSFIPTIDSVTTCVLSKRWSHLWEHVPKLSFDDSNTQLQSVSLSFANIVNRALSLHHTNLSRLSLRCGQIYDVTKWVSNSITRNIQSLDLHIDNGQDHGLARFRLPSSLFTCATLESLTLEGNILPLSLQIFVSQRACLPRLRTLKLVGIQCPGTLISACSSSLESLVILQASLPLSLQIFVSPSICMPISNCASLETLIIDNLLQTDLNISSSSLKVIELRLFCPLDPGRKLVIDAPALNYLKLTGLSRVQYNIQDLPSLEQADVCIIFCVGMCPEFCSSGLLNVLQALRHVKSLKINQHNYKVGSFGHVLPMFHRLTDLDVTIYSYNSGVLLDFIMNSATKLKNLTLEGMCGHGWRNPNSVPACLLTSVRSVVIRNFKGGVGESLMAKYILKNARILEKMEICFAQCSTGSKRFKKKVCGKILKFCRGSEKCVVFVK